MIGGCKHSKLGNIFMEVVVEDAPPFLSLSLSLSPSPPSMSDSFTFMALSGLFCAVVARAQPGWAPSGGELRRRAPLNDRLG
jgi:hypothetical protein